LNTLEDKHIQFLKPNSIFRTISSIAGQMNQEAYVIGGFVRDQILKRSTKDIDIVTLGSGIELAEKIAKELKTSSVKVFKNFGSSCNY
jgi:tRNA nucleotidyltransferase/poly(A) polymerase